MTLALAYRCGDVAYLIADSIVTAPGRSTGTPTTFLEHPVSTQHGLATEGCIKVLPCGNGALAFAGNIANATEAIDRYRTARNAGLEPFLAMRRAIHAHDGSTIRSSHFDLMVADRHNDALEVLAGESDGAKIMVVPRDKTVFSGSSTKHTHNTLLASLHQNRPILASMQRDGRYDIALATLISDCVNYGRRFATLPSMFGGAYYALAVTPTGLIGPPRMLFVLGRPDRLRSRPMVAASVVAHEGCLYTSNAPNLVRCLHAPGSRPSDESMRAGAKAAVWGPWDFGMVMDDSAPWNCVVVGLRQRRDHPLISTVTDGKTITVRVTKKVLDLAALPLPEHSRGKPYLHTHLLIGHGKEPSPRNSSSSSPKAADGTAG